MEFQYNRERYHTIATEKYSDLQYLNYVRQSYIKEARYSNFLNYDELLRITAEDFKCNAFPDGSGATDGIRLALAFIFEAKREYKKAAVQCKKCLETEFKPTSASFIFVPAYYEELKGLMVGQNVYKTRRLLSIYNQGHQ